MNNRKRIFDEVGDDHIITKKQMIDLNEMDLNQLHSNQVDSNKVDCDESIYIEFYSKIDKKIMDQVNHLLCKDEIIDNVKAQAMFNKFKEIMKIMIDHTIIINNRFANGFATYIANYSVNYYRKSFCKNLLCYFLNGIQSDLDFDTLFFGIFANRIYELINLINMPTCGDPRLFEQNIAISSTLSQIIQLMISDSSDNLSQEQIFDSFISFI